MNPILALLFKSTALSSLLLILIHAFGAFLGKSLFDTSKQGKTLHLFLGTVVITTIMAMVTIGLKTIFILFPVTLIITWFFVQKKDRPIPESLTIKNLLPDPYEFILVPILNGMHILMYYDFRNKQFFKEWIDRYQYSEQVTYLQWSGIETHFVDLENFAFGESYKTTLYHHLENYLSMFYKCFTNESSFKVLHLMTYPFLLILCLSVVFHYLSPKNKIEKIAAILFCLVLGTLSRVTVVFNPLSWIESMHFFKGIRFFPTYVVSEILFNYLYDSFKISAALFLIITWIQICRTKAYSMIPLFVVAACVFNPVYIPFFAILTGIQLFRDPKSMRWIIASVLIPITYIGFYKLANLGIQSGHPSKETALRFTTDLGSILKAVQNKVNFIIQHFYPLVLFSGWILFLKDRRIVSRLYLPFLLTLPIAFISSSTIIKIYLVLFIGAVGIGLNFIKSAEKKILIIGLITSNLFTWLLIEVGNSIHNISQSHEMTLVASLYFIPILFISGNIQVIRKPIILFALGILVVLNIYAVQFFHNRNFYRKDSGIEFVNSFLRRSNKLIKAGYVTDYKPYPYFYHAARDFGDIQNETDSLFLTSVSLGTLTKADSIEITKIDLWDIYNKNPIVAYGSRTGKGKSLEEIQRNFIADKGITVLFRLDPVNRKYLDFANKILADSIHNDIESYWIYFLKDRK